MEIPPVYTAIKYEQYMSYDRVRAVRPSSRLAIRRSGGVVWTFVSCRPDANTTRASLRDSCIH